MGEPTAGDLHIREAVEEDLPVIRDLFNALIPTTTIAWREHLADEIEMATWFAGQRAQGFPVLVGELDGRVVGYTCWGTFRGGERIPGYRHTVELTLHVDGAHHRRGLGRALLGALLDEARRRGDVHVLVAGIDADSEGSLALHAAMGFAEVARMPEVGRKHGRWLDLVLVQRIVDGGPQGTAAGTGG
jgi:L-amino acid N-acyltransferase YncA